MKNLFGTRLNFFAKKALKNAILFAYPTQQEDAIAESAELGCYTVENKEELVAEGIKVYQMLGNISEEAFLRAEGAQGWDRRL